MAFEVGPGVKSIRCAPPNERHRSADFCGAAYTVVWPDHERIDRILAQRLLVNQNWEPGEPISLLVAENLEHGCGLPAGETGG